MVKIKKNAYYRMQVLNFIYNNQPVSRIRIGEITGIRLATITEVVKALIEEGLVKETGKLKNRQGIGRKENMLEIIPEGRFFVGCELRPREIQALLLNFKGEIVHTKLCEIADKERSEVVLSYIEKLLRSLIKEKGIPHNRIYGMGFVDPGIIDVEKGISISSTIMPSWKNVPVKKFLEEKLKFRVFLINTSQAKVLAEHLFGKGKGLNDLVFIEYGEGISCGIISNSSIIGGYTEVAGEMGHCSFPGRDERCRCGRKGCLEAIASIPSIERKVRKLALHKNLPFPLSNASIKNIIKAYEQNNPLIKGILDEASLYMGIAVANVIKLLNPELVILDKNFSAMGKKFLDRFFNTIKESILYGESVKFTISSLGKEQAPLGGAALCLQNFLKKLS
ncbi:MAG TPA: ROK family transcriptional regulator [bacterium]|nr:ROK family transcriptional regulator [bacterium]HPP29896.1 ROK family transcriptional regulator [bacterium]